MFTEIQKYLFNADPVNATLGMVIFLLTVYIVRTKIKEMNGANKRLHDEMEKQEEEVDEKLARLERKINGIAKCLGVLKKIVYKLEGRMNDD